MITFDTDRITFDSELVTWDGWSFGSGRVVMALDQSDVVLSLEPAQPILLGVELL